MSDRLICNSCSMPKATLEKRKSKITNMDIFICRTCIDSGYEPRHLLIIGYRSGDNIRKKAIGLIEERLYVGETIALTEVL